MTAGASARTRRVQACHSIDDLREAARRALPRMVFDYIDGAAQTESTARENRAALDRRRLLASAPVNVAERSTATSLFDRPLAMPLIIGPTGYAGATWPGGDLALARAASRKGIPFVISNGANSALRDIATASDGGRLWLQVYLSPMRDMTARLVEQAKALGLEAIEVTVDTALPGRRLRDNRNGFTIPFAWTPGKLLDVARRPRWALASLRNGTPRPGLMEMDGYGGGFATVSDFARSQINPAVGWDDIARLRDAWPGKLLVKGILDPAHMTQAIATGCDGVVISNHGGRQLDGGVATIDVLEECVAAAAGRMPVLIDSGFRSGTDILRAVALGAAAVQIGRATLYGLAAGGEAGVTRALELFEVELDLAMALTGLTRPAEASPKMIRQPTAAFDRQF